MGPREESIMSVKMRQHVERDIALAAITGCLSKGYNLTVDNGEERVLLNSRDKRAILAAMFTTDEEHLLVNYNPVTNKSEGWIFFVYGNDGWDVISDYTTNLESALSAAQKRADYWEK
jgi:hypothetical protein